MLDKLFAFLARIAVGKQIVSGLAFVHDKLNGKRSEIIVAILAIVHILKLAGVVPPEAAESIETSLAALLPLTLADRARKVLKTVDSVVPPKS